RLRAVTPVLADRVGDGLAVADRPVEIDHHRGIALPGIGLRIPAVAPAVAEAALRAAVDQERHRVFLARLVVPGLDHVAVHGVAVPAGEAELLVVAEGHVGQHFLRARGDRALGRAADAAGDDLVAALERVAGEHRGRAGEREAADAAVADHPGRFAAGDVHREQRVFAHVRGGGVDRAAVFGQDDAVRGAVPVRRDLAHFARGQVHRHQAEAVGLEAGTLHRAV